jgi:cell division septal protein FtsQ|tara:strand:+ start:16 stop:693 length:678 start_codon:yes stop_codon:yes gene_type:complete
MPQRKGKKILIYFFLLLLVGSINNEMINSFKFEKIKNINVLGLGHNDNQVLLYEIIDLKLGNIFFLDKKNINKMINSNTLIHDYEIFKRYPHSIDVNVKRTKFLAKIKYNNKIFLIGSNGKLSPLKHKDKNNYLPFIFGKPEIDQFLKFKRIIDNSKFTYKDIDNLFFFSTERWDIQLKNDLLIKLPSKNIKKTLDLVSDFLIENNNNSIKTVDARIQNQIILDD